MKMEIVLDNHTKERAIERGVSEDEIIDTIKNGNDFQAKTNRKGKYKIFQFNNIRNKVYYKQKRVEVIYLIEKSKIITITVYAFYGKWE